MPTKRRIVIQEERNGQTIWKQIIEGVITVSQGPQDAGSIVQLGPDGKFDPSVIPGGGGSTSVTVTLMAAETINQFQAVAVHTDGLAYRADSSNLADSDRVIGIAATSATVGNSITVQQIGSMNNLGWSWTPGQSVYLGLTGALVTSPNIGLFELPMGTTISATELEVQIGSSIIFA